MNPWSSSQLFSRGHPPVGPRVRADVFSFGGAAHAVEVVSPATLMSVSGAVF